MTPLWDCLQGSIEFPVQRELGNVSLSIRDAPIFKNLISHWPDLSHWKVIALIYSWIVQSAFQVLCSKRWHFTTLEPGFTAWRFQYVLLYSGKANQFNALSCIASNLALLGGCLRPVFRLGNFLCCVLTLGPATTAPNVFCFSINDKNGCF